MNELRMKCALTGLQWSLGIVILIESLLFVFAPGARHDFAGTHMPDVLRLVLGWGEITGAVLLLISKTAVRGAWMLAAIFLFAIAIHLLHGMFNVGYLVIYTAASVVIAIAKSI